MGRRFATGVLAVAMLAGPVAAQRRGMVEGTVIVRGTMFDPSFKSPQSGVGFGGRLGVYVAPKWLFEADLSTSSSEGLDYQPLHVRVNFLEEFKPGGLMVVGLGYARNSYSGSFDGSDGGFSGNFGFRLEVRGSFFTRVDGVLDYIPSPVNGAGNNWNFGFHVGAGYRLGRQ